MKQLKTEKNDNERLEQTQEETKEVDVKPRGNQKKKEVLEFVLASPTIVSNKFSNQFSLLLSLLRQKVCAKREQQIDIKIDKVEHLQVASDLVEFNEPAKENLQDKMDCNEQESPSIRDGNVKSMAEKITGFFASSPAKISDKATLTFSQLKAKLTSLSQQEREEVIQKPEQDIQSDQGKEPQCEVILNMLAVSQEEAEIEQTADQLEQSIKSNEIEKNQEIAQEQVDIAQLSESHLNNTSQVELIEEENDKDAGNNDYIQTPLSSIYASRDDDQVTNQEQQMRYNSYDYYDGEESVQDDQMQSINRSPSTNQLEREEEEERSFRDEGIRTGSSGMGQVEEIEGEKVTSSAPKNERFETKSPSVQKKNVAAIGRTEKFREVARKKRELEMQLLEINQELLMIGGGQLPQGRGLVVASEPTKPREVRAAVEIRKPILAAVQVKQKKIVDSAQFIKANPSSVALKDDNQVKVMIQISDNKQAKSDAVMLVRRMNLLRKQKEESYMIRLNKNSQKFAGEVLAMRAQNSGDLIVKEFKKKNIVISRMQEYEIKKIEQQKLQEASRRFVHELSSQGPRDGIVSNHYVHAVTTIEKEADVSLSHVKQTSNTPTPMLDSHKKKLFAARNFAYPAGTLDENHQPYSQPEFLSPTNGYLQQHEGLQVRANIFAPRDKLKTITENPSVAKLKQRQLRMEADIN